MAILSKRSSALDPMRPSQVTWSGGDSHSKKQFQGRCSVTQEAQRMRHREVTSPQSGVLGCVQPAGLITGLLQHMHLALSLSCSRGTPSQSTSLGHGK